MIQISARHLWIAVGLAVLGHGLGVFAFYQPVADLGAKGKGIGGIEIDLGRMGSAPGSRAVPASAPSQAAVPAPQAASPAPPPVEAAPVEVAETAAPAEAAIPKAVALELVRTEEPPPDNPEEPVPEPVEAVEPEEPIETDQPQPVQAEVPEQAEPDSAPSVQAVAQEAVPAGAEGRSGTQAEGDTGSGQAEAAGGRQAARASYLAKLKDWLEERKVYPSEARIQRIEGTVRIYFTIDADGTVLESGVRKTSGHAVLDRAAEDLIARAQPLPAPPSAFGRRQFTIVAPIRFELR